MIRNNPDEYLQQMFNRGLKKDDFLEKREFFTQCPLCTSKIGRIHKPALFTCGHICCTKSECITFKYCAVCNSEATVKEQEFIPLVNYIERQARLLEQPTQNLTYNFNVRKFKPNTSTIVLNQPSTALIKQVLSSAKEFVQIYQKQPDRTGVIFNGKGYHVSKVIQLTIRQFIQKQGVQLISVNRNQVRSNEIFIYDYFDGGR